MILDEMFRFPCVMVDGDNEMAKKTLFSGSANEPALDIVIGEAAYPYFGLIGLVDKWMPNEESFKNALEYREFDACLATFANIGPVLVPWKKEKFEKEYRKFVSGLKPEKQQIQLIRLTEQELKELEDGQQNREES